MATRPKGKLPELLLGALPIDKINKALDTELAPGVVVFSGGAQVHAARNHPAEYSICLPHLANIVTNPLYIGDDHKNHGKIELISRIAAANAMVLVAINLERDAKGRYHVLSFYTVKPEKIEGRRLRGFLKLAPND